MTTHHSYTRLHESGERTRRHTDVRTHPSVHCKSQKDVGETKKPSDRMWDSVWVKWVIQLNVYHFIDTIKAVTEICSSVIAGFYSLVVDENYPQLYLK